MPGLPPPPSLRTDAPRDHPPAADTASTDAWWRDDTQQQQVVHLNNAGASLQPAAVVEAVLGYVRAEATLGGYEAAAKHAEALQRPYTALAQLLNCSPQEIAIVSSATSAWGQVFWGIPFQAGDRIITCPAEYGSNYLAYLQARRRFGVRVEVIPETPAADLDIPALQALLQQQPTPVLVAICHVPTSSGRAYNAAAVGAAAAAAGVPFLLDACQSAGQLPLDVQALRCDFLTGTSRKYLRGPRGIGFLYARQQQQQQTVKQQAVEHGQDVHPPQSPATPTQPGSSSSRPAPAPATTPIGSSSSTSASTKAALSGWEPAMVDIHGARWSAADSYSLVAGAAAYEQFEVSCAAKVGFGVAVEHCLLQGLDRCWARTQALAARLRQQLAKRVPGLSVQDRGACLCGIVSFTLASHTAAEVKAWLAAQQPRINVSVSARGSTRLDMERRGLTEVVRASVAYYNADSDLEALVDALQRLVAGAVVADQADQADHV